MANYNYCVSNGLYDLHDISANEFGHWFWMNDVCNFQGTCLDEAMTLNTRSYVAGTYRRDLTQHDKDSACAEYGYQGRTGC